MAGPLCNRKGCICHHCQTPPLPLQTRDSPCHLCLQHLPLPPRIPEHPLNPCPNPIRIDRSKEYEVESIVDSKYRYQCLHYLIKFKGWPNSDNEWLLANHLANAPDIIQDFHHHHPSTLAPHPMSHP